MWAARALNSSYASSGGVSRMPRPRRVASRSGSFSGSGAFIACPPEAASGASPPHPIDRSTGSVWQGPKVIIAVATQLRVWVLRPGAPIMGRVLLVDDDPAMILDQAIHALGPQGIRIEVAHTAEEGLRQIAAQPPDVILLDVHLPDLSGLDAFQRIRRSTAASPSSSSPGTAPPTPPSRR